MNAQVEFDDLIIPKVNDIWKKGNQEQNQQLDDYKRNDAFVQMSCGYRWWSNAFEVKQCKTKWWR